MKTKFRNSRRRPAAPQFRAATKDTTLELLCYDYIGANWDGSGVTAANFAAAIKDAGDFSTIRLRINSPGGDAFEGVAIFNLLRAQGKTIEVYIDGLAASSASIIAMAGDTISIGENAMVMIHNAWSIAIGDATEMRKTADLLDKVSASIAQTYVTRTGNSAEDVKAMMDAETWLSAEECVEKNFADSIQNQSEEDEAQARALAGRFNLSRFRKAPAALKEKPKAAACECDCPQCQDGECDECSDPECDDPNCEDCPMQAGADNSTDNSTENPTNLSQYEARLKLLRA